MQSYKALVTALIKAVQMDKSDDKIRKIKNISLSIFAVVFILLPIVAFAGFLSYLMTEILAELGHAALGVHLMFSLTSIFTVVFGLNVIINEFYFSADLEHILPFPFKAWEITMAKFTTTFFADNIMQFLLVFSCIIGFGMATGMSIVQWIFSFVLGFFLPLAPLLVCAILGILMMNISRFMRRRQTARLLSVLFMVMVFGVMAVTIMSIPALDIEAFIINATKSDAPFIRLMDIFFPQIGMLTNYMETGSIWELAKFLVLNVVLLFLFYVTSEKFYIKSVTGISGDGHKKVRNMDIEKNSKCRSVTGGLFFKEIQMLLRTPVFLTNCILVTFIWPVFVFLVGRIMDVNMERNYLIEAFSNHDMYTAFVFIFSVSVAIIMTSMNSLGSNAFSREGQGIFFMKFIPVNYKVQWNIKAAVSIIISVLGTVPFMIVFGIYIKMNILQMLICALLQLSACIFVTYLGLLLDSINPKLVWEDALTSLRENYNTFFCMAISIFVAVISGIIFYFVCRETQINITLLGLGQLILFVIADCIIYRHSMIVGIQNLKEVIDI